MVEAKSVSDENCLSEARKLETTNSVPEQRIGTAFSISNLNSILTRLGLEKQEIVKAMGFGMLLKLSPQTKFPRQLLSGYRGEWTIGLEKLNLAREGN